MAGYRQAAHLQLPVHAGGPMNQMYKTPASQRAIQGVSLVEMMVALAIGLVVVGAVFVSYLGTNTSGRQSTSLAQMTEDGTVALNLLRTQIAMAGYSRATAVTQSTDASGNTTFEMTRAYNGLDNDHNDFIVGCDGAMGGFANDNRDKDLNISDLSCQTVAATKEDEKGPDAIAVAYEADTSNTMGIGASGSTPTDCLGRELLVRTPGHGITSNAYVASNRFYLATGPGGESELYCQGNGGLNSLPVNDTISPATQATPQPLVENITDLQITYGIANVQVTGPQTVVLKQASRYMTATDIRSDLNYATANFWSRVVSVRICVEVRSVNPAAPGEGNVALNVGGYVNCHGEAVHPHADGHLRRSFWTTVVLHNRI
jgi:type IV pilus assembly protein PilW